MILRNFLRMGLLALVCGLVLPLHVEAAHITLDPNNSNDFVSLDELLDGSVVGVVVGDKVFDEFFYSTVGNDMPDAADIDVFGFQDNDGNWGISLHGVFLDLPGGGPSDALLRFTVSVTEAALAQGWRIGGANLFAGGVGLGDDSFLGIDESFQENSESLNVFSTTLGNGPPEQQLSDSVDFDELYTSLRVTKDILAIAGNNTNQPVRTTAIDQSFSQVQIPEPTTIMLVFMGSLAIVGMRRRN